MTKSFSMLSMDVSITEICCQALLVLCVGNPGLPQQGLIGPHGVSIRAVGMVRGPRVRAESDVLRLSLPLQGGKGEEL